MLLLLLMRLVWFAPWIAALVLTLLLAVSPPLWAADLGPLQPEAYLCDGDPLQAQLFAGAVDATNIPNTTGGTVPGATVVLRWRGQTLQLPRTNNAGPPSYTDGRWWWSPVDPEHPEFKQRRGGVQSYVCRSVQPLG